ncbi:MAG: hypothetical protein QXV84_05780 [Conexivisphaerales archaeon]
MSSQPEVYPGTIVLKFYSKAELLSYIRSMVDFYQRQVQQCGDKLGELLRAGGQTAEKQNNDKQVRKGWSKIGSVSINMSSSSTAYAEIMFQMQEEMKQKLARVSDVLKSVEGFSTAGIAEDASFLVYFRNGLPEAIIVNQAEKKREPFVFSATFKVV